MSNRYSNVIFNTSIWDNNDYIWFQRYIKNKFIKFVIISYFAFVRITISFVQRKVTRKNIN